MKFGLFTCGYQRFDIEKAFQDAQRFGYDYVELWGARPHAYPYDLEICANRINELIKKYNMPVTVYTPELNAYPFNLMWENESMRDDSLEYVYKSLDFAKAIGAEYTLISAGHAGFEATEEIIKERLYDSLEKIIAYAEKVGIKIVYEPLTIYESNVTTTSNQLLELCNHFNSPYFFAMNDIVVPYIQGENIIVFNKKLGSKLVHMHIVDSDGQSEDHYCPGYGNLPLKNFMQELSQSGYDKTVTIELVTKYLNEPSIYAKLAIDNLKEGL